ncbi:SPFH domain-containing protein [Vibrio splendidus]|nr:SPFH domain-containing protein [Vibrio splendidus]MCC4880756.1 hypothetical protein [Vibrio splendidus]
MESIIMITLVVMALVWLCTSVLIVKQKQGVLINFLGGRIVREIENPGIYFKLPAPFQMVAAKAELEVFPIGVECTVTTDDEVVMDLTGTVSVRIAKGKIEAALYELSDAEYQIKADARQLLSEKSAEMTIKQIFNQKKDMIDSLVSSLNEKYIDYGYEIVRVNIDDPKLPDDIIEAKNRVEAERRNLEASIVRKQAIYNDRMAEAEADASALERRTESAVKVRGSYADTCITIHNKFKESATSELELKLLVQSMDALDARDAIATASRRGNAVLMSTNNGSSIGSEGVNQEMILGMLTKIMNNKNGSTEEATK